MAILVLKPKEQLDAQVADDEIVLSAMDQRIDRRLVTPLRVAIAAGVASLVALTVYAYLEYGLTRTLTVGAERVTVSAVAYDTFREYIPVTGNVVPRTTVYLDAIEGGQITAVHVEEGALVTAGQPLVTFKNANLELQVIGAEAQLTEQLNYLSTTRQSFEQSRLRNRRELIDIDYQIDRLTRDLARPGAVRSAPEGPRGLVPSLASEALAYYESVGKQIEVALGATESDDKGRFSMWVSPDYTTIHATADGYDDSEKWVDPPAKDIELVLTPAGNLVKARR